MRHPGLLISVLLLIACRIALGDPRSQFEEGLVQYRSDNWEQAVTIWEQVLDQGYASGALYYNLGNAYFRLNELSRSILAFERAAQLMPRDADVKVNLAFVRMSAVDRIEQPVRLSVWDWIDSVRDSLTHRELAALMQMLGMLLAAAILVRFLGSMKFRAALRPVLIVLIISYIASISWYSWRSSLDSRDYAVIMTEKVSVFSGPDETSTQLFALHEGTKIEAREALSGWMRIRLADGREGWLLEKEIEVI